jgi:hypothetical protein
MLEKLTKNRFGLIVSLLCLTYFFFELFYNQYAQWSVDDFWFSHVIYQFKDHLPYRDFSPYKTVLGYYFLLPLMSFGHDALTKLLYTKNSIAFLNALLFFFSAYQLKRFFSLNAVLTALVLLITTDIVLSYSTNIRVDLLAYWLCLYSVLLLLDNQFVKSGLVLGISFLISQKVIWYMAASDIALGTYWLSVACNRRIFWGAIQFNFAIWLPITAYIFFWAMFSDLHTVLHNVFYEAYVMSQLDCYDSTRFLFWSYTLQHNPYIFLMWPLSLMTLFVISKQDHLLEKRIFIITYTTVVLFFLMIYKQVFPYYMLTTLPAFLLLYASFFSWLYIILKDPKPLQMTHPKTLWGFLIGYFLFFIFIQYTFELSFLVLSIGFISLLLGFKITSKKESTLQLIIPSAIFIITFFMGIAYPLVMLGKTMKDIPRDFQKSTVQLTEALLKDGSDYLSGIELIYNKNQPIPGLRHLDAAALIYLYHPNEKLGAAMLSSLYHTPDITTSKAITYLKSSSIKFYVNNYRIDALPPDIKRYLNDNYQHFWGSIYLYAPAIEMGLQHFNIKLSGKYQLKSADAVQIDHKIVRPNSILILTRGPHISQARKKYRLYFQETDVAPWLQNKNKEDLWLRVI